MNHSIEIPLGKLFSQLTKEYVGTFTKRLENLPINRHFYPLVLIAEADGKLSQTSLACELNMDKVSVVRLVDYLSEHDCVVRRTNPADRREHLLLCTKKGESFIPEINKAMVETNELCLGDLSATEVKLLHRMLSQMHSNLQHQPQDAYNIEYRKKDH